MPASPLPFLDGGDDFADFRVEWVVRSAVSSLRRRLRRNPVPGRGGATSMAFRPGGLVCSATSLIMGTTSECAGRWRQMEQAARFVAPAVSRISATTSGMMALPFSDNSPLAWADWRQPPGRPFAHGAGPFRRSSRPSGGRCVVGRGGGGQPERSGGLLTHCLPVDVARLFQNGAQRCLQMVEKPVEGGGGFARFVAAGDRDAGGEIVFAVDAAQRRAWRERALPGRRSRRRA